MPSKIIREQLDKHQKGVMVERKAMLSSQNIEMHYYETIEKALNVKMRFENPVIAVMLKGEKVIEMDELGRFEYNQGESLIIPSGKHLKIDFPSATIKNPTQCLAFVPEQKLIEAALFDFYESTNTADVNMESKVDFSTDLLMRDQAILQAVNYLLFLFQEQNEHRDLFINMTTKELVIRMLQSKSRRRFLNNFHHGTNNRMSHVSRFIKSNISKSITIDQLAKEAGMSKSSFFSLFKNTFAITPNEFVIKERIKLAKKMLTVYPEKSITQISTDLGYSESSYFTKQFKAVTGISPSKFTKLNKN